MQTTLLSSSPHIAQANKPELSSRKPISSASLSGHRNCRIPRSTRIFAQRPKIQHARCRSAAGARVYASSNGADQQTMKVMISGAPATGKGTQCLRILDKFGLIHISAGDLLRAEVAAGTPAGREASSYMDSGNLVPNSVVVDMITTRLEQDDVKEHGWLLDGYPRSGEQAEAIEQKGIKPDLFVLINVPDEELVDRVAGRRLDPDTGKIYHMKHKPPPEDIKHRLTQRSDDTAEKVKTRLHNHHSNVDAVLGYYQDVLVEVDGTQNMEEVFNNIDKHLVKLSESRKQVVAS